MLPHHHHNKELDLKVNTRQGASWVVPAIEQYAIYVFCSNKGNNSNDNAMQCMLLGRCIICQSIIFQWMDDSTQGNGSGIM